MLSKRLKELREQRGLTQSELAEKLDIGRASVSNYENKDRKPDADVIIKMADFFGVTTDYLLGKSNFKTFEQEYEFRRKKPPSVFTPTTTLLIQTDDLYSKIINVISSNNSRFSDWALKSLERLLNIIFYLDEVLRQDYVDDDMDFFIRFLKNMLGTGFSISDLGNIQPNQRQINSCREYFNQFLTSYIYAIIESKEGKDSSEE